MCLARGCPSSPSVSTATSANCQCKAASVSDSPLSLPITFFHLQAYLDSSRTTIAQTDVYVSQGRCVDGVQSVQWASWYQVPWLQPGSCECCMINWHAKGTQQCTTAQLAEDYLSQVAPWFRQCSCQGIVTQVHSCQLHRQQTPCDSSSQFAGNSCQKCFHVIANGVAWVEFEQG